MYPIMRAYLRREGACICVCVCMYVVCVCTQIRGMWVARRRVNNDTCECVSRGGDEKKRWSAECVKKCAGDARGAIDREEEVVGRLTRSHLSFSVFIPLCLFPPHLTRKENSRDATPRRATVRFVFSLPAARSNLIAKLPASVQ